MVRVTVNGVYLHKDEDGNELHFVLLLDQQGQRNLQIWIGKFEAWMISLGQEKGAKERPMTYDFIVNLLGETGARVEEVRIQSLRDETFYAVVHIRVGDALREIDARPSDALALAVRTDTPVFVADEIMESVGRDYSAYNSLGEWLGRTGQAENMANLADEGALTRITYAIVQQAIRDGAAEIRFDPQERETRIRYRIRGHVAGGALTEMMTIPNELHGPLVERFKTMADLTAGSSEGRIPIRHDGKDYTLRVSVVPTPSGEGLVMGFEDSTPRS